MIMAGGRDARDGAVGTLPQAARRDFSAVGYDEAMRRARELVPLLRERAAEAEDARMLIRANEQLLHESGLFRFHQPKSFGGMELDFVAVVDIPAELARGCPSTAWNVGNVACHHWILGYYDPETQREVWDSNPDALIASSIALAVAVAPKSSQRNTSRTCSIRSERREAASVAKYLVPISPRPRSASGRAPAGRPPLRSRIPSSWRLSLMSSRTDQQRG